MSTKRDEYVKKLKAQLDEMNTSMDALEAKAKDAREDLRAKYQEEMAKLRAQSKQAKAQMAKIAEAGEDKWEAMTAEMDKVRDAFAHSYNYFKSQLK